MKSRCRYVGCLWSVLLLTLAWLLTSCSPSGDSDLAPSPLAPSAAVEAQAIGNLLDLYSQAQRQEDIDRFQALLQPEALAPSETPQDTKGTVADLAALRDVLATTFLTHTLTNHAILPDTVDMADDHTWVSFVEVESVADSVLQFYHSRVYRTTLTLQRSTRAQTVQFHMNGATREGPIAKITTQGRTQTDLRSRVTVTAPNSRFSLERVAMVEPATGEIQTLRTTARGFTGPDCGSGL